MLMRQLRPARVLARIGNGGSQGGRDICLRSLPWQSPCICQRANCEVHSAGPCSYAGRDTEFELALTGRGEPWAEIVPSKDEGPSAPSEMPQCGRSWPWT